MYCKRENKCIFMFQKNLWSFLVLHGLGFLWGIFHFWQNSSCILVKHKAQMVNQILITCKMIYVCTYIKNFEVCIFILLPHQKLYLKNWGHVLKLTARIHENWIFWLWKKIQLEFLIHPNPKLKKNYKQRYSA